MSRLPRTSVGRRLSWISSGQSVSLFQLFFFLSTSVGQQINPSDSVLTLFPSREEQMVEAGSNVTITWIGLIKPDHSWITNQSITWEIPDNIKKVRIIRSSELYRKWQLLCSLFQDINGRLRLHSDRNGTHITSSLTLINTAPEDTGYFKSSIRMDIDRVHFSSTPKFTQYVYVYSWFFFLILLIVSKATETGKQ